MLFKSKNINSCNYWVYSWFHSWYVHCVLFMGPSGRIVYILHILDCLGQDMQVLNLGRAPRTKETLPDFREKMLGHPTFTNILRVDG